MAIVEGYRQILVKALSLHGIAIKSKDVDCLLKEFNRFEMPLSTRQKTVVANPLEFIQFIKNQEIKGE